jgi:hypothetical protein
MLLDEVILNALGCAYTDIHVSLTIIKKNFCCPSYLRVKPYLVEERNFFKSMFRRMSEGVFDTNKKTNYIAHLKTARPIY